ncbi:EF-hand domain-containing protein [Prosthecobacter dejongeii]|uniref:EF-hand domain-containing protein n=1 Tax=Prosthecobacter dejongeii TaxID=48465 RepID=A0A7W7YKM7_9BACT|nr:EF-hand domain-containing protein [Prosthecobacter dejongeii]MBB5037966.1 hypothetical protein [Prosthecobacter dejongeii]
MKHPIFCYAGLVAIQGALLAQVPSNTTAVPTGTVAQPQVALISQEAAWWLANPQALFQQLDVDKDGLLNYNEFSRVGVLSTQVAVPANSNGRNGVYAPNAGVPANNGLSPAPGVKPMTGPQGTYTPPTGVPPVSQNGGSYVPTSPPPPVRPGP